MFPSLAASAADRAPRMVDGVFALDAPAGVRGGTEGQV